MRDELARMMGWQHFEILDTLDAAAAYMPAGWTWLRTVHRIYSIEWSAHMSTMTVRTPDTGDEKYDRFALALAARKAMKGNAND
jgi:hypothetical protein